MMRGHKGAKDDLSAEYVRQILHYDPDTGIFTWRVTLSWRGMAGNRAGGVRVSGKTKRIKIGINGAEYMGHRLAWLYVTGEWPQFEVDHRDEDGTNNEWNNLRPATSSENLRNRGPQANNRTGYKGVCFDTRVGKFLATIKLHGKQYRLGHFRTPEAAHAAYVAAAEKLHGEFRKVV